ncbi:MAG TPA: ABC transporter substrate-binding protein [Casimicrobiaceae bacterium]
MIDRRAFIGIVAGGLGLAATLARADRAARVYRIGWLRQGKQSISKSFWDSMRELGWVEGQNIKIEPRYSAGLEQLPALAAELVRLKVDLMLTDSPEAARAARDATATIPIVFVVGSDPVGRGLVASLARPGGNLTGFAYGMYEGKMLETLKAALPRLSRVAVPVTGPPSSGLVGAAKELAVELQGIETPTLNALGGFFDRARQMGADAALIPNIAWVNPVLPRIGGDATSARFPAIGPFRPFAEGGGLLAYGPFAQHWPRFAVFVDKILRGARPADLPVEQPTRFTTVINLGAAKALGLRLPQWLLLSADEIIDRS